MFIVNDIEDHFNINLKKKFGDRDERNQSKFLIKEKYTHLYNFNAYNKPKESFKHYLLIKHDNTIPVLMDTPDRVIWTWDLSNFRNKSKIIPYHLFNNGDLIIGRFETKGIFRINKNGKIIWKYNGLNHHWIDVKDDKIYIPSREFFSLPNELSPELLKSELKNCNFKKSAFDTILILDSKNGNLLKNIKLMDKLIKNEEFLKLLNRKIKSEKDVCSAPLHLNDIQKLSINQINLIKNKIKLTSEEILILSFRSLDTVIFYDMKNNIINHLIIDLFTEQHSPRLHDDGYLYVFNNDIATENSKIVKINLKINKIESYFTSEKFKSGVRGRIQFIKNELFIQSSSQGEIFKIDCKIKFFESCKEKYLYSSNFSFFTHQIHMMIVFLSKKMVYILVIFMKKIKLNFLIKLIYLQVLANLFFIAKVNAYVGLGPLLPIIGTVIAYVFIGIITIFGFVVYPFRLIHKKFKKIKIKTPKNEKN